MFWVRSLCRESAQTDTAMCVAKHVTEDRCKVLGGICPDIQAVACTMRRNSGNRNTTPFCTDSISTESATCSRREEDRATSLVTTLFFMNGVLVVRTVADGGFIVVQLLKKMRRNSRVPEYDDTYVPLSGIDT